MQMVIALVLLALSAACFLFARSADSYKAIQPNPKRVVYLIYGMAATFFGLSSIFWVIALASRVAE